MNMATPALIKEIKERKLSPDDKTLSIDPLIQNLISLGSFAGSENHMGLTSAMLGLGLVEGDSREVDVKQHSFELEDSTEHLKYLAFNYLHPEFNFLKTLTENTREEEKSEDSEG